MHDKWMTGGGRKQGKPVATVKHGSIAVPIYRSTCRGRVRFTVAFYLNGRRQGLTFGSLDTAREEARHIALNIQRGLGGSNDLRPRNGRATWLRSAC